MIGGKEERNGYLIEEEKGHYKVTRPDGSTWTEDTHKEAVKSIEKELKREGS